MPITESEIGIWFLLLGLFLPRFVLFFWWLTENLPHNTTPMFADVLCSIFLPRVLILVYIYGCQGLSPWFYIHLVALVIAWGYNLFNFQKNMEKAQEWMKS
jgi:hypothetical protein